MRRAHDKVVIGALRGLGTEWKKTHYANGWCQWTACQPPQSPNSIYNLCTLMHHPSKASWTITNLPLSLQHRCFYGCNLGFAHKEVQDVSATSLYHGTKHYICWWQVQKNKRKSVYFHRGNCSDKPRVKLHQNIIISQINFTTFHLSATSDSHQSLYWNHRV